MFSLEDFTELQQELEQLRVISATMAYLDYLQSISISDIIFHGEDAESRIYIVENRRHSPMIRYVGDDRTFQPWDVSIMVSCSDFFDYASGDYEDISTMDHFYIFKGIGDMLLTHYTDGKYTELTHEVASSMYLDGEQEKEISSYIGELYSIARRRQLPISPHWLAYPAKLKELFLKFCEDKSIKLHDPYKCLERDKEVNDG